MNLNTKICIPEVFLTLGHVLVFIHQTYLPLFNLIFISAFLSLTKVNNRHRNFVWWKGIDKRTKAERCFHFRCLRELILWMVLVFKIKLQMMFASVNSMAMNAKLVCTLFIPTKRALLLPCFSLSVAPTHETCSIHKAGRRWRRRQQKMLMYKSWNYVHVYIYARNVWI